MSVTQPLQAIVLGLRPFSGRQSTAAPPALPPSDYERARNVLGPGPVDWAIGVARHTADLAIGDDANDPRAPIAEVKRATEAALVEILEELAGGPPGPSLGPDQREVVRLSAARDIPFERIVEGLRLAQSYWTELLLDQAGYANTKATLKPLLAVVGRSFDRVVGAVIREYLAEQARQLDSAAARRRDVVDALIDGRPVEPDLARARLGINLDHEHLALVVQTNSPSNARAAHIDLRRAASAAGRLFGVAQPLLHDAGEDQLWVWITKARIANPASLRALEAELAATTIRVSVGSVRSGAEGFRRSHLDARAASVIAALRAQGGLVFYRQVELAALVGHDLDAARWFVRDHLGGLATNAGSSNELRKTLDVYYESNMSLVAAALPLHVHRNTVVHRLHRIEEILGHPVSCNVLEVRVALQLVSEFGDSVLVT